MSLLNLDELKQLQALQEEAMPDTARVQRKTSSDDGAGGTRKTPSDVGSFPCQIAPVGNNPQGQIIAARLSGKMPYIVKFPAGSDVKPGDEITVKGQKLTVIEPLQGSYETALRVVCVEVQ